MDLLYIRNLGDECGYIEGGLKVPGVAHLGVASTIVYDKDSLVHQQTIISRYEMKGSHILFARIEVQIHTE